MTETEVETVLNKIFKEECSDKGYKFSFSVSTWEISIHPEYEDINLKKNEIDKVIERLVGTRTFVVTQVSNERIVYRANGFPYSFDYKNKTEFKLISDFIRAALRNFVNTFL